MIAMDQKIMGLSYVVMRQVAQQAPQQQSTDCV
jgi:hypothetical protein